MKTVDQIIANIIANYKREGTVPSPETLRLRIQNAITAEALNAIQAGEGDDMHTMRKSALL